MPNPQIPFTQNETNHIVCTNLTQMHDSFVIKNYFKLYFIFTFLIISSTTIFAYLFLFTEKNPNRNLPYDHCHCDHPAIDFHIKLHTEFTTKLSK